MLCCTNRRTLSVRKKTIHAVSCQRINEHFFIMDLTTQAGTYVKEFVHGDLGRTMPNVGSLLQCDADILQLDVLEIDLDFPPQIAQ
jgi:tRNA pseudouridine synthase 10